MKKIGIAVRENEVDYMVHKSYITMLKKYHVNYDIVTMETDLDGIDAFLIPGGNDIDSSYYQEENYACKLVSKEMDELDRKIILYAIEHQKPLLGICRGIQSLNVFMGGSLKQDILNHNNENHFIYFQHRYYLVNSFHHQSIAVLAPNLIVLAESLDHEIEIVKHQDLPIYGLAFHPELMDFDLSFFFNEI